MGEPSPPTPPSQVPDDRHPEDRRPDDRRPDDRRPEDRRLDSWKEIAAYLSRDVTTVQRWEKREGMPVHRQLHDRAGTIYAFQSELDAWVRARTIRGGQGDADIANREPEGTSLDTVPSPLPVTSASPTRWTIWLPVAGAVTLALALALWLRSTEYFWRSPIADAQVQTVTDFEGISQAAALSRDGKFAAFLSDRDGPMDVWVTQVGSGELHNLTRGSAPELVNPSIRTLGFSPDGSTVTFWVRKPPTSASGSAATGGDISIWAVPTLGGRPKTYLDGAAEFDWSRDGSRLAYHTPGPGDPLFVSDGLQRSNTPPIFVAPSGLHSHFPLWSPDNKFLYFVQGTLPDKLDIWRIPPTGGVPERISAFNNRVTHPVFLDSRTILFLAGDPDAAGPSLYSLDVERRIPHRLSSGLDRYTSLDASADGHRLIVTSASTKRTLWRLELPGLPKNAEPGAPTPVPDTTPRQILSKSSSVFSPRLGSNFLVYAFAAPTGDSIRKLANDATSETLGELWASPGARILGGPALSPDRQSIAFSVRQRGRSLLYVMQADGTNARMLTDALDLQGAPAWAPDAQSITTAAQDHGVPHLYRVPLDGHPPTTLVKDYSVDPAWSPDGSFAVYSGPDIGTKFAVKGISPDATPHPMPDLTLTRGARHLAFLPGGRALVFLHGEIKHKNLWLFDLKTGAQRELTNLPADFDLRDFDISPDGREVILERAQERSDVAILDLPRP